MSKKVLVAVPFAGMAYVYVEKEDGDYESDLIGRAVEKAAEHIEIKLDNEDAGVELSEWEVMEHIVEGNVFYGPLDSARIETDDWEDEEDDDD